MPWKVGNTFFRKFDRRYEDRKTRLVLDKDAEREHLRTVICQDGDPPSHCVTVHITTVDEAPYDRACVLSSGHWFIDHDSWVVYHGAEIIPVSTLEDLYRHGDIRRDDDDMHPLAVVKMLQGGLNSKHTPKEVKEFLRKHLRI